MKRRYCLITFSNLNMRTWVEEITWAKLSRLVEHVCVNEMILHFWNFQFYAEREFQFSISFNRKLKSQKKKNWHFFFPFLHEKYGSKHPKSALCGKLRVIFFSIIQSYYYTNALFLTHAITRERETNLTLMSIVL